MPTSEMISRKVFTRRLNLGNIALFLVSLIVMAIVLELGLRLVYRVTPSPEIYKIPDPILGWRLQPDVTYTNQHWDFQATVSHNSEGWRDVDHDYAKPADVFRIVTLGDSYIEGYTVDDNKTFHRVLESMARDEGYNVEVINLAVAGFGTLQEYLVFENHGKEYAPDLIVLVFYFGNDLVNNSLRLARWRSEDDPLRLNRPYLLPGDDSDWRLSTIDYEAAMRRFNEAQEELAKTPWWQKTSLYSLWQQAHIEARLSGLVRRSTTTTGDCREFEDYHAAWRTTGRIFEKLKKTADEVDADVFVTTVAREEGRQNLHIAIGENDGNPVYCADDSPAELLDDVLQRAGMTLFDMGPAMRAGQRQAGGRVTHLTDAHWNSLGHQIAAWSVLDELLRRGLLNRAGQRE